MSSSAMAQQVNLFQPILGAERRLFSAQAIGLALSVLASSLCALALYGSWKTQRIESSVEQLARQEEANITRAGLASAAARPNASLEELTAQAKTLSADIEARQHALDVLKRSETTPAKSFAARLESLAARQIDGIWLTDIALSAGEGGLSMRGGSIDPRLLPQYLAALAEEPALSGVRFDKLAIHRATPAEAPALVIFDLNGPDLPLPEHTK